MFLISSIYFQFLLILIFWVEARHSQNPLFTPEKQNTEHLFRHSLMMNLHILCWNNDYKDMQSNAFFFYTGHN